MRIALAGGGLLGGSLLSALLDSHHQVVALVQDGRKHRGWRRTVTPAVESFLAPTRSVVGLAKRNRVPISYIDKMTEEELEPLRRFDPDLLLVGGFSIILKQPLLSLPRIGCLNTHSSLLPKHRGPNPFTAVVLAEEPESGVTFHIIDEGIDTGDIVAQFPFPLEERETGGEVHRHACEVAMDHVLDVLDRIEAEGLRGTPQDHSAGTYDKKIKPEDSFVDWHRSAEEIDRMVRALAPFVFARCRYRGREIRLYRTEIDETPTEAEPGTILESRPHLKVATGDGAIVIKMAFRNKPFMWYWPSILRPPKPGEKLD